MTSAFILYKKTTVVKDYSIIIIYKINYILYMVSAINRIVYMVYGLLKYLVDEAAGFVFAGIEDVGVGFCGDGY